MKHLITILFTISATFASVTLTIESLTTQNEYFTSYSGEEYLWGTLEIGITTEDDISGFSMGISHYNGMGIGLPYGGLVEEYDFEMTSLFGSLIGGGHNMFPQEYYIPAGTTNETLMYVSILISETNDEEFCILPGDFYNPEGNSLTVVLNENSCISIEDMTVSGIPVAIINDGAEDAEAEMGSTFTLDATSSFDPDGTIESYFWSQSSEGTQVEFSSENESIVTFTVPTEENDNVVCIVSLTVTDNDGNTALSQLTITGIEGTETGGSATLTIESLTTQNEYVTTYSGSLYLQGTLEIGITTEDDITGFSMGITHYNGMGLGQPYGGLVEEYDFYMTSLNGALIYGGHNMFPQDYYIPAGTTDETLMYVPILISETNDEEFCIEPGDFINLEGDILDIILDEEACINIDDLTGLDSNETNSDTLTILIVDSETGHGIEGAEGVVSSYSENDWYGGEQFNFVTNDSGYAFIEGFPIGYGTIAVFSEGHYFNFLEFSFTGTEQITVAMEPYGFTVGDTDTLEIKFTDSYTGEGIPNVTVDIYTEFIDWGDDCWNNECFISVETDSSGLAVIRDFPLSYGWIEASKTGYENLLIDYLFDGAEQLEFMMQPHDEFSGETDTLVFYFVDSYTGQGIPGIHGSVWSFNENGNSFGEMLEFYVEGDNEGYAVIENFPVGYHGHGEIFADGYLPGHAEFQFLGSDTIVVGMTNLGISATVSGTVEFENESNSFLLPFVFAVPMNDSYSSSISPAVMVDGVGNYELSLSPGDYAIGALHFNSPDYYWYNDSTSEVGYQMQFFENASTIEGATVIQVAEGGELGNINFDLINGQIFGFNGHMGNMVMGQVTSDNNTNMENTIVSVKDYNGNVVSEQTIGSDQNFTLTGLNQNEPYVLSANHSEYGIVEKSFTVSNMIEVESIEFSLSEMSSEEDLTQLPKQFSVSQNYPNPFNPTTTLEYTLPENMAVQITIFDNLGRVVKNLFNGNQGSGYKKVVWDATDNHGQPVSAGVYMYSIVAGENRQTKKMILLK